MTDHPLLHRPRFITVAAVALMLDALVGALAGDVLTRLSATGGWSGLPLQAGNWLLAGVQVALALHLLRGGRGVRPMLALWGLLVAADLALAGDLQGRLHTDTLATALQINTVLLLVLVQGLLWRPSARQWLVQARAWARAGAGAPAA